MIDRYQTQYLLSISQVPQLESWLHTHPQIKGVAFCGRSNVGKSSIINCLFGKKTARTSNTPGRTQAVNIFTFKLEGSDQEFFLFDLPGFGYAKVSQKMQSEWNQLMGLFFSLIGPSISIMHIQDARHPWQKADHEFNQFTRKLPSGGVNTLIFNKIDKLKTQKDKSALSKELKTVNKAMKVYQLIFKVSAETREGIDTLEESIVSNLQLG